MMKPIAKTQAIKLLTEFPSVFVAVLPNELDPDLLCKIYNNAVTKAWETDELHIRIGTQKNAYTVLFSDNSRLYLNTTGSKCYLTTGGNVLVVHMPSYPKYLYYALLDAELAKKIHTP